MPGIGDQERLIDDIYGAAHDGCQWPRLLERLTQEFGSSSAHLSMNNFSATQGRLVSFGTDPAYASRYAGYYASRNVLWQRMLRGPLDGTMTDRTVMPKQELRRSEFYNDFLRPQGGEEILISVAQQRTDGATTLTLWRPERFGAWEPRHMKALARLAPHLRRAVRVSQGIGDLRIMHDVASAALQSLGYGVILVGAQGQVLFANHAAEAMLADAGGLRVERQCLTALRASDAASLRRVIAAAAEQRNGASLVIRREERPSLQVLVTPVRAEICWLTLGAPRALVLVKDLERAAPPCLTAFVQYFGLTPAQAALAREMIRGDGVAAAAARVGMSYKTARTHLLHIFQKTETRRQAELVRLMLEWNEGAIVAKEPETPG